jgi:hypothetical protein
MSESDRNTATIPRCPALHHEGTGFAVTVLPASPYEVSYVPAHHVIGFTFEGQHGVDAFGGSRRRLFYAEPWRLAFTPAGCDVFSASDRGGEYLMLRVVPETFACLAPEIASGPLSQFTNVADTTLHAALMERRIARARLLMEGALRRGARPNFAEVAAATGFSSHAHMTTAFGRVLGITPSEWMRTIVSRSRPEPTDHSPADE